MALNQANRMLAITTPLGPDVLAVRDAAIEEGLSRLFQIQADLSSENGDIEFDELVGHNVTIRLKIDDQTSRFFNGFVSRLVQSANRGGLAHYQATIVPWLWFLTRSADCRIFQNKKIPDILEEVFRLHEFTDFELRLSGTYETREFCVQYRETAYNFVSRLMEQEGIYYYFLHEDGKHTLVLADSISAHSPIDGYEDVPFLELEGGGPDREVITDWIMEHQVQPVAYVLNDFDFMKPKTPLKASADVTRQHGGAKYELYDYPGEYLEHAEGTRLSDVRLAELQSQFEVFNGQANARGLAAGSIFNLKNHPRGAHNREYLITGVSMRADAGEVATDGSAPGGSFFSCNLSAIDSTQPFRPPRVTPKPVVQGPQTAIVVGPSGEEIHTDEHARVKVHFHWDRYDEQNENSSCFIRVSQPWAGKGWGSMATPRIGQEVIVDFLEGDPDRPIITGRVYNADCPPPYAGGSGVVSGLKSNTHKGSGSNEMSMDDTAGKEKITIHAQYDMGTTVEHDDTQTVHNDRTITVDGKHTETIKKDTTIKISEGKLDHDVVAGTAKYHVQGAVTEIYSDKQETTVNKDIIIKSETTKIHVTAATEIQLKVGASKLLMKSDGKIELSGTEIAIAGSAAVRISGDSIASDAKNDHNISGNLVVSEGKTSNTVKGGTVMLNP